MLSAMALMIDDSLIYIHSIIPMDGFCSVASCSFSATQYHAVLEQMSLLQIVCCMGKVEFNVPSSVCNGHA